MNAPHLLRGGLYLLTPDEPDTTRLLTRVAQALGGGGVALLQYRNKTADAALRGIQARALKTLCDAHDVPLIVNDDVALARDIGAAGVHLGADDGDPVHARTRLGDGAIVGVSCYADRQRAERAARAGASYVAFGAFHPSGTKPGARAADASILAQTAGLGLPRVAIGGITADNARALVEAGADFLAVIGSVFDAPDPARAVAEIGAAIAGAGRAPARRHP